MSAMGPESVKRQGPGMVTSPSREKSVYPDGPKAKIAGIDKMNADVL